jgi:glycosyltransferase involved in cell wall biosynthesis
MTQPLITVAIPSFNQGRYLEQALESVFSQAVPVEVFVLDGGSTDETLDILDKWSDRLAGWRSRPDEGQAAAINEGVALGRAPYVCWLNSDDFFLKDGLTELATVLSSESDVSAVYGGVMNYFQEADQMRPVWVEAFDVERLAVRCIISQPGTLIRRTAWQAVGGVDASLHMAMDYDLWWRLYKAAGPLHMIDKSVAVNREHALTKTNTRRFDHYREAIDVVRRHNGRVPLKWWIAQPYAVWFKTLANRLWNRNL